MFIVVSRLQLGLCKTALFMGIHRGLNTLSGRVFNVGVHRPHAGPRKHQPKRTSKLNGIYMSDKEDPKTLFDQLILIESRYKDRVTDLRLEEQLAVIIRCTPESYQSIIATEQQNKGNLLTLDNVCDAMEQL